MKIKLEYIWLDGYQPEQNLRSKTKVWDFDPTQEPKYTHLRVNGPCPEELPIWSFDGSSTRQAEGNFSDCLLKPVRVIMDPQRKQTFLVMCEVLNPDGSPHESNTRNRILDNIEDDLWFGFEQEYTLIKNGKPIGFPKDGNPNPQGMYYCSVGSDNVSGRDIAEQHMDVCLSAGLNITGINAEVLLGQWEYQIFGKGDQLSSDDLWLSRYFLHRICEHRGIIVEFHPKPVKGDWNGSGLHTNFSNRKMREEGGETYFKEICEELKTKHSEHIKSYGSSNELRLTGEFETADINTFTYGVSDRGASIRIPIGVVNDNWKGYLEDRRPSSNADPYKITKLLCETLSHINNLVITH